MYGEMTSSSCCKSKIIFYFLETLISFSGFIIIKIIYINYILFLYCSNIVTYVYISLLALSAAITCAGAALSNAGVEMFDLPIGCTLVRF